LQNQRLILETFDEKSFRLIQRNTGIVSELHIFGWVGWAGWAAKLALAEATETTACFTGHMTYSQVPEVCVKKNIFHYLFDSVIEGLL